MFIFHIQLITSRIGNLTQLIYILLHVKTMHTYMTTFHAPRFVHHLVPHLIGIKLVYLRFRNINIILIVDLDSADDS